MLHLQWLAAPQLDARLSRPHLPAVFTAHDLLPRRTAKRTELWRLLLGRFERVIVHSERGRDTLAGARRGGDAAARDADPVFPSDPERRDDGRTVLCFGVIRALQGARRRDRGRPPGGRRAPARGGRPGRADRAVPGAAAGLDVNWRLGYLHTGRGRPRVRRGDDGRLPCRPELDQSGALLRALGAGVPAVAYDVNGVAEPVRRYECRTRRAGGRRRGARRRRHELLSDRDALEAARVSTRRARAGADLGRGRPTHLDAVRGDRVIFRRQRFVDVIARQLDLFAGGRGDLIVECQDKERAYDRADREDAEEAYGDYVTPSRRPRRRSPRCAIACPYARRGRRGGVRGRVQPGRPKKPLAAVRTGDREPLMPRIEDYALIGDLQTAALVSAAARSTGSACRASTPAPASPRCSARRERPLAARPERRAARTSRRYRDDTLVLETTWETADGAVRVVDFMPPRGRAPDIVRIVEGVRGRVRMRTELDDPLRLRPHRALGAPRRRHAPRDRRAGRALLPHAGARRAARRCAPSRSSTVDEGERVPFVLTWYPSHEELPRAIDPEEALAETESWWREWNAQRTRRPPPSGARPSSARSITLKALTYAPTGGIVAAPTTSLPERLGGVRNWDYRYCWLRDATLTLLALLAGRVPRGGAPRGATGSCAPSPATRPSCRSCTASPASGG